MSLQTKFKLFAYPIDWAEWVTVFFTYNYMAVLGAMKHEKEYERGQETAWKNIYKYYPKIYKLQQFFETL